MKLSAKQQQAISGLLSAKTVAEAAQQAQVSERTLYRWLGDPVFRAALAGAEAEALAAFSRELVGLARFAAEALRDGLDPKQPIHVRLRAADIYAGRLIQLRQAIDFEQRLAALEAQFASKP